ncbi:MAG: hypothetical protein AVDCRST_MAG75-476 [uncultured Propionibacteriaceae bacterium]|uniref:Uncharacterized protein n=1 Tax=uncultured Propionibacteriaceae bacterium TaxID=257457 RepID=A0A6J4N2B8_9ACTN|nr:MAG: hypothetical protein AVDCRST_MAG75-476 [uncultured Propionibacteriaceae bacterium]
MQPSGGSRSVPPPSVGSGSDDIRTVDHEHVTPRSGARKVHATSPPPSSGHVLPPVSIGEPLPPRGPAPAPHGSGQDTIRQGYFPVAGSVSAGVYGRASGVSGTESAPPTDVSAPLRPDGPSDRCPPVDALRSSGFSVIGSFSMLSAISATYPSGINMMQGTIASRCRYRSSSASAPVLIRATGLRTVPEKVRARHAIWRPSTAS